MSNRILHSITGLFDTPDQIINAAKEVNRAGYKNFDIHTPYPVHGMDDAMQVKRSPLGYIAFVFGVIGAASALLLMFYTMTIAYPNNIGGKPFFSLPAFIPVTFELTVLLASVGTVAAMIIIFFKFPNNSHPLHDTDYMRAVSSDKYGLAIASDDKNFDLDKVKSFFGQVGAHSVNEEYWDQEELDARKSNIYDKKFILGLAIIAVITMGTTYFLLNKAMFMEPFNWMMKQQKLSAMAPTHFFSDGFSMREPVEGTVSRNHIPYPYPADSANVAEQKLVNPLEYNENNMLVGKARYDTYCSPCHDYHGTGIARLNGQFPNPPSLHTDRARGFTDGRIFHIITKGQNTMPSYAKQISENDRWKIVQYVRSLQRAMNAKEEDMQ